MRWSDTGMGGAGEGMADAGATARGGRAGGAGGGGSATGGAAAGSTAPTHCSGGDGFTLTRSGSTAGRQTTAIAAACRAKVAPIPPTRTPSHRVSAFIAVASSVAVRAVQRRAGGGGVESADERPAARRRPAIRRAATRGDGGTRTSLPIAVAGIANARGRPAAGPVAASIASAWYDPRTAGRTRCRRRRSATPGAYFRCCQRNV